MHDAGKDWTAWGNINVYARLAIAYNSSSWRPFGACFQPLSSDNSRLPKAFASCVPETDHTPFTLHVCGSLDLDASQAHFPKNAPSGI